MVVARPKEVALKAKECLVKETKGRDVGNASSQRHKDQNRHCFFSLFFPVVQIITASPSDRYCSRNWE